MKTQRKIGLVDLDTSHPGNWVPIIRELGYEVAGVFDGGTVHPDGYAREFAAKHGIPHVYDSVEQMVDEVDIAIIHSCNWELHVERSAPFVRGGKSVLIDKPLAGNERDLRQLQEWESGGARIAGGSSLRFCREVEQWRLAHPDPQQTLYAYVGCGVDEFNYGIHAYSLLLGLLGEGVDKVRLLGERHRQRQIELEWSDGRRGVVGIGPTDRYLPFYATITTEDDVSHIQVDNGQLYKALLERTLPYLAGEADAPPIPLAALAEAERSAIAGRLSGLRGGQRVGLAQLPADDAGYDGAAFAAYYRGLVRK